MGRDQGQKNGDRRGTGNDSASWDWAAMQRAGSESRGMLGAFPGQIQKTVQRAGKERNNHGPWDSYSEDQEHLQGDRLTLDTCIWGNDS